MNTLHIKSALLLGICINCPTALADWIAAAGTEGFQVIVKNTKPIVATYQGNSASYSNDLYLMLDGSGQPGDDGDLTNDKFLFNNHADAVGNKVTLGAFPVGTELIFRLHVNDTGDDFFTGAAGRNPDNHTHARVQANWTKKDTLVSFEDLFGGSYDYNDLSFSFTNVRSQGVTSIDSAQIAPTVVKLGDSITVSAVISGDVSNIGDVAFMLGDTKLTSLTDSDGDGTWTGQYTVTETPGYQATTKIYAKDTKGKVLAKWPGFTVTP